MTFVIGDKVKVVNYGHLIWAHKDSVMNLSFPVVKVGGNITWMDMNISIVGKEGIVSKVSGSGYALEGIPEKHAWYYEDQLEMVSPNPNRGL